VTAAPAVLSLALAIMVGWLAPAVMIRALVPVLESSALARPNYRGRTIVPSLGLVWLIWALLLAATQAILDLLLALSNGTSASTAVLERFWTTPLAIPFFVVPFMLVAGCVALGLADDAFAGAGTGGGATSGAPQGFRGHLGALRRGTVTTGMLKMLGIGALAFFYGVSAAEGVLARSTLPDAWSGSGGTFAGTALLATLVIALSANLLNLLDLRPGRALKAYAVLIPAPAVALALSATAAYNEQMAGFAAETGAGALAPWEGAAAAVALVVVMVGPALAVWRLDLREHAMLGDAGSNTMGAIVGYLLTSVLSFWGLAAAAAVLLALNLLSERVSFSAIIDRVPVLRWLDALGRGAEEPGPAQTSKDAAVPETRRPPVTPVRYHSDVGNDGED